MAITWFCACGKSISTDESSAGTQVLCPFCRQVNVVPDAAAPAVEQKKVASSIPEVLPVDDDAVEVIPEDEVPELDVETEEIPEIEVEEHVAEWDKVKKKGDSEPKPRKKKEVAPKDLTDPFDIPEIAGEKIDEEEAKFTKKQAETGMNAWVPIGNIKLTDIADCVCLGPGGAYGLCGQDDDVLVINMFKGKKLDRYGGHDGVVTCLAMSATGDCVVSGDDEGDVNYWEIPTRRRRRLLRDHEAAVTAVTISPSGEWAASCDREGSTRLWHLQSGEEEPLADSDWPEKVTALTFSTDNAYLAAGSSKGRVVIWKVKKGTALQRIRLNSPAIASLQFAAKGETLIAACKPEQATSTAVLPTVWRIETKTGKYHECMRPAEAPRSFPYLSTLDPGGRRLICLGKAIGDTEFFKGLTVIEIWSLATGQRLHVSGDFKGDVNCIAIAPNNGRLVASLAKRQLQVFAMPDRDPNVVAPEPTLRPDDRFRRKHG